MLQWPDWLILLSSAGELTTFWFVKLVSGGHNLWNWLVVGARVHRIGTGTSAHTTPRAAPSHALGSSSFPPCALLEPTPLSLSLVRMGKMKSLMSLLLLLGVSLKGCIAQGGRRGGLTRRNFPDGFVFGTASSSYQVRAFAFVSSFSGSSLLVVSCS
jgi:hypothetical protein